MDYRKELLLASAARLYSMGVDQEAARAKRKELVEQWKALEQQHLELKNEFLQGK